MYIFSNKTGLLLISSWLFLFTIFSLKSCSLTTEVIYLANVLVILRLYFTKLVLECAGHFLKIALKIQDQDVWKTLKHVLYSLGIKLTTFALATVSMLLERSSISILYSLFSFSSFCLTRWRLSICSPSSATVSACFLRRPAAVASCWSVDSSRSRRSFWNSASRFLFISIWAAVAPPASSSLSLISSSSPGKISSLLLNLGTSSTLSLNLFLQFLNASLQWQVVNQNFFVIWICENLPISQFHTWSSLIFFWSWAPRVCSSSILLSSWLVSKSFL